MKANIDNDPRFQEEPEARCQFCRAWTYEADLVLFEDVLICQSCKATEDEAQRIKDEYFFQSLNNLKDE